MSNLNSQEEGPSGPQGPTSHGSSHNFQSGGHEKELHTEHSTIAGGGGLVPLSQESNESQKYITKYTFEIQNRI